jgi:hypothetical protein
MGALSRLSLARRASLGIVVLITLTACGDTRSSVRPREASRSAADEGAEARAVRAARAAQNRAIAALDTAAVASFWTEDVEIRGGHGSLVVGRETYRNLFNTDSGAIARGEELIYQREPATVEISARWPLAFEEGSWTDTSGGRTARFSSVGATPRSGQTQRSMAHPRRGLRRPHLRCRRMRVADRAVRSPTPWPNESLQQTGDLWSLAALASVDLRPQIPQAWKSRNQEEHDG